MTAPCGLPPVLRARGWAEQLSPVVTERPDPPDPARITIAVLPDTQYYTSCRYPHFENQVRWLTQNAGELKLHAALHLGDITESNDPEEWLFAKKAMAPLLDSVPTFMATGNHDHGELGTANRRWTQFNQYFTPLAGPTQAALAATAVEGDLENAYYRLVLPKVTIGVLVLGWSPEQKTVTWANRVLTRFPKDRVIFVTHAYLYSDSTRYDWVGRGAEQEWNPNAYGLAAPSGSSGGAVVPPTKAARRQNQRDVYDGERLWTSLVSRHKGIFLTLNGHVLHHGTGRLTSTGRHGNQVQQVLVNYQMLSEGGAGYLRLLEIPADGRSIRFRTYSPSLRRWAVAPEQHFELPINPALW
jgi:Calcineurin-like phosphoesterase